MNMKQIDAFVRDACIAYINSSQPEHDIPATIDNTTLLRVNDVTCSHRTIRMYILESTEHDDDAYIVAHITKINDDDEYECDMITYEFDRSIDVIHNNERM